MKLHSNFFAEILGVPIQPFLFKKKALAERKFLIKDLWKRKQSEGRGSGEKPWFRLGRAHPNLFSKKD